MAPSETGDMTRHHEPVLVANLRGGLNQVRREA
jgi:hypothetical protein